MPKRIDFYSHVEKFIGSIRGDRNPYTSPDRHSEFPWTIAIRWMDCGLKAGIHTFNYDTYLGQNLFVRPKFIDRPYVLLMAHHDTMPNNNGVNTGSGVAVVDAIATWYNCSEVVPDDLNLAFALTDLGEGHPAYWNERAAYEASNRDRLDWDAFERQYQKKYPNIKKNYGTRVLFNHLLKTNLLDQLQVVLNFDSVGYTSEVQHSTEGFLGEVTQMTVSTGDFVAIVGNEEAREWVSRFQITHSDAGVSKLAVVLPKAVHKKELEDSEQAVFWQNGYPALLLTDTGDLRDPNTTHRESDLDLDFLVGIINLVVNTLLTQ